MDQTRILATKGIFDPPTPATSVVQVGDSLCRQEPGYPAFGIVSTWFSIHSLSCARLLDHRTSLRLFIESGSSSSDARASVSRIALQKLAGSSSTIIPGCPTNSSKLRSAVVVATTHFPEMIASAVFRFEPPPERIGRKKPWA